MFLKIYFSLGENYEHRGSISMEEEWSQKLYFSVDGIEASVV